MPNAVRGELGFEAREQTFLLVYDFDALAAIEDELGLELGELGHAFLPSAKVRSLRALLRIGLRRHHGGLNPEQAGEIMEAVSIPLARSLISDALVRAFPAQSATDQRRPRSASADAWDLADMLSTWVELGQDAESFWQQTPRTLELVSEGRRRAAMSDHRNRAWLAWTTASCQRAKKMPRLRELISEVRARRARRAKPKSADYLWAMACQWIPRTVADPEPVDG